MKFILLSVSSGRESWAEEAGAHFRQKIRHFAEIEELTLKPAKGGRDSAEFRREADSELLLKKIQPNDYVIAFDERGSPSDSRAFSKELDRALESARKRVVFLIGGPFGLSAEILKRADRRVSLSSMTMNHHVAGVMALEQIYRAWTIRKGLPYHND